MTSTHTYSHSQMDGFFEQWFGLQSGIRRERHIVVFLDQGDIEALLAEGVGH